MSRCSAAGAGLLAAIVLTGCMPRASGIGMTLAGGRSVHCREAVKPSVWHQMLTQPTEFAVDYVTVSSSVQVTKAVLRGGNGKLVLDDVAFVPGGVVGDGFVFGDTRALAFPREWAGRQQVPHAALYPLTMSAGTYAPATADWQIVVGVRPTASVAYASGLELTVESHGRTHRLMTQDYFGLAQIEGGCDAVTAPGL